MGSQVAPIHRPYLDGHSVAALGGDDAVVSVVVDGVVVDGQEVAVVVGVEPVRGVVVHLVPPPVSLLMAVRVDPEVVVMDVRVVDVAVDVNLVEQSRITRVHAKSAYLAIGMFCPEYGRFREVKTKERLITNLSG